MISESFRYRVFAAVCCCAVVACSDIRRGDWVPTDAYEAHDPDAVIHGDAATDRIEEMPCWDGSCHTCLPFKGECVSDIIAQTCREDGSGWDLKDCADGLVCVKGECLSCVPGQKVCAGTTDVVVCAADGSGFEQDIHCRKQSSHEVCEMGRCVSLCDLKNAIPTNQGCHFVAIDMEQGKTSEPPYYGEDVPFAVVIVNSYPDLDAYVWVRYQDSLVEAVNVPRGQSKVIHLGPSNISGVGISDKAFQIDSNLPVVAYQFNQFENVDYSGDASLLLPIERLGSQYRIVSMPNLGNNASGHYLGSNFAVVAVEDGDTKVTITPRANVPAGSNTARLDKGLSGSLILRYGEVFNVSTESTQFLDLTGSLVVADKKIAVFSGHVCAVAPMSTCVDHVCTYDKDIQCASNSSCPIIGACDHLEEQLSPLSALGNQHVIPKTKARGNAPDLIRVVAMVDNTGITIIPPVAGYKVINAGEYYEFEIDRSVVVQSDKPFLSAIILEGEQAPGSAHVFCADLAGESCTTDHTSSDCSCSDDQSSCQTAADCSDDAGIGDPSLIHVMPVAQFISDFAFYVPATYRNMYVSLAAPVGAKVKLDGALLESSRFSAIQGTSYMTAVLSVTSGPHIVESDVGVGVYVYGWESYVSYGYSAGMGLSLLNAE